MVLYGPRQNKTVIRFVTDLTQKYVGWKKPIEGFRASALSSMGFFHPTYFCARSVTNLIINNVCLSVQHIHLGATTKQRGARTALCKLFEGQSHFDSETNYSIIFNNEKKTFFFKLRASFLIYMY